MGSPSTDRPHPTQGIRLPSSARDARQGGRWRSGEFPLSIHDKAQKAAEAARCAEEQGRFWELHDQLFAHQDRLAIGDLKAHARQLSLDGLAFDACLDSGQMTRRVKQELDAGVKAGVDGTPAFFINGLMLSAAQPFDAFKSVIEAGLVRARR